MMLLRSAHDADLDDLHHLAKQSGIGLTTLPKDKELLKHRLAWSCTSFNKNTVTSCNEYYLFVLEDQDRKKIVGTSAIEAKIGFKAPFYSYKISKHGQICTTLNIHSTYEMLNLVNDYQGCSELCTLFLTPSYRKNNNGLLLSKARFLFMALNKSLFTAKVIAEMRGVSDKQGYSPFWEQIGNYFFHMPFSQADELTLAHSKQFIADLMPPYPIYIKLLSPAAQAVLGAAHPSTLPAMNILLKEGFRYNNYIDIFDAGPTIEAFLTEINTIKANKIMRIITINEEIKSPVYLLANTQANFRATVSNAALNLVENTCSINKKTAALLQVTCGDELSIAPIHT